MVNKVYKVSSVKEEKMGSKHNQILMSIVGKIIAINVHASDNCVYFCTHL